VLRFGSLRTRIVVLTTVPLLVILLATLAITVRTANHAVRRSVHQRLTEAGSVFVQLLTTKRSELVSMAQVIVRDPRFFATFSIPVHERGEEFRPTLEDVSRDFLRITDADFLEIFDRGGAFVTRLERDRVQRDPTSEASAQHALEAAMRGAATTDFYTTGGRLAVAAVAPVYVADRLEAVVRLGNFLDEGFAHEVRRLTGADVCLARDGHALASTFPPTDDAPWPVGQPGAAASITLGDAFEIRRAGERFLATSIRLDGASVQTGFDAFVGRELSSALAPLIQTEQRVALGGLLAVLVTLVVGFVTARTITRPLHTIVDASAALKNGRYDHPIETSGRDEVAELGRNFDAMRTSLHEYVQHLENLDQAKSNFIALASHELRTPLTVVSGFNEMIAGGAFGEIPEKVLETTRIIKDQLADINTRVQAMLDLTYLEQGLQSLVLAPIELNALVRSVVGARRDVLSERGLRVDLRTSEEGLWAQVDASRMTTAVQQLIDNAIRFTPDGGSISVTTRAVDAKVFIMVEDTGIGIPPSELRWIFQKIYEVGDVMHHSSGRHAFGSHGFGLGLALCKAIVEAHGGEIRVDSTLGRGSRFTITVPRVDAPSIATEPQPEGAMV
jgi:signal transduction histidine kinase